MVATNNETPSFSEMELNVLGSLEDLSNPLCRELYSYWSGLKSADSLQNFDLIDIPKVIPFMVVLEHLDDEQLFRFKMSGQSIVEASRHDLTGDVLSIDDERAPLTAKICQMVLERQLPVYSSDSFAVEISVRTLHFDETIGLPLFSATGSLAQIILVHGPRQ